MSNDCNHDWIPQNRNTIYNWNGEYVEGHGWGVVFVPAKPNEFHCKKCKSLKKIDCEGEVFIYPPKPNPFEAG